MKSNEPSQEEIWQKGAQTFHELLRVAIPTPKESNDQREEPPRVIEVATPGQDINVTVVPPKNGQPVKLRLHITSATLIPIRPRRRRNRLP